MQLEIEQAGNQVVDLKWFASIDCMNATLNVNKKVNAVVQTQHTDQLEN